MTQSSEAATTEHKFTAADVENNCPDRLQQIGREITERLKKADKQTSLAVDHVIAVNELIAEAKKLCNDGGFNAFREKFCPTLGRSRAYTVLAITAGKKTIEQDRAESRVRQANKRASDKERADDGKYTRKDVRDIVSKVDAEKGTDAAIDILRTVGQVEADDAAVADLAPEQFDKVYVACAQALAPTSQPVRDVTEKEGTLADPPSVVPGQQPEPAEPRRAVRSGPEALSGFDEMVNGLIRMTRGQKPQSFAATAVPVDDLAEFEKFITKLVIIKSKASKPATISVQRGNGLVSAEQSADDRKAENAALAAGGDFSGPL